MAAQTDTLPYTAGVPLLITDNDVTEITFQNLGPAPVKVIGTVGAVAPTDGDGGYLYKPGEGEKKVALADLWPGSAFTRVYVLGGNDGKVAFSHA